MFPERISSLSPSAMGREVTLDSSVAIEPKGTSEAKIILSGPMASKNRRIVLLKGFSRVEEDVRAIPEGLEEIEGAAAEHSQVRNDQGEAGRHPHELLCKGKLFLEDDGLSGLGEVGDEAGEFPVAEHVVV